MRRSNARTVNCDSNNHDHDHNHNQSQNQTPEMDPAKLQFRSGRPSPRFPYKQSSKLGLWSYISITCLAAVFCYFIFFARSDDARKKNQVRERYGIVIDGGSTGSRIHVFKYEVVGGGGTLRYDFGEKGLASMRVNPGLSAYAAAPEGAATAVEELVAFGRKVVPREYWVDTEVRLLATAGMRMLDKGVQDGILEACRKVLRSSGFRFRDDWATVISGSDEGMYAWVVANYALGTLGGVPQKTTGIIELGGASAQVTFATDEPLPPEYSSRVNYGNHTYNLYSHSLLQFGQNVAFDLLREGLQTSGQPFGTDPALKGEISDPCTPRGYTHDTRAANVLPGFSPENARFVSALHPSGNFSECRSASLKLLQKDKEKCSYKNCYIGATFIPKLQGKFLATENFFHTSKFFGLSQQAFLSDLVVAGQSFCGDEWSNLKGKYHSLLLDEEDMRRYCFSSAYIVALLHDSLGIALDDERIGYANQIENIPLDWALGAFILQSASSGDNEQSPSLASVIAGDTKTLFLLSFIFLVLISTGWIFSKCRKPQLKTIYDLEKGKYITTRVSRYS